MKKIESKTCPCCGSTYYGESKSELAQYFGYRNKKLERLSSYCKECRSKKNKERYEVKKDDIKEKTKRYYRQNTEYYHEYYLNYYYKNGKKKA